MLLVRDTMTSEVKTLAPDATAAEALEICRKRRIRHLPVLEDGRLVGIVSDRDLQSVLPPLGEDDSATPSRVLLEDTMAREVVTAHPRDPIEDAAGEMYERRIGCLPVVSEGGLVGIITSSDAMRALVVLLGAHRPGSPIEVEIPDRPESLPEVTGILKESNASVVSILTPPGGGAGKINVLFRLATIDPLRAVAALKDAGYRVLYPPE